MGVRLKKILASRLFGVLTMLPTPILQRITFLCSVGVNV
jgi:hypothetical protein